MNLDWLGTWVSGVIIIGVVFVAVSHKETASIISSFGNALGGSVQMAEKG